MTPDAIDPGRAGNAAGSVTRMPEPALPDHLRSLAPSPFPGDDGLADPTIRRALAGAVGNGEPTAYLGAVAALCRARLLVPVVATRTDSTVTASGVLGDKEAEMAVVLLQAQDGRRAMLAFTGMDALNTWDGTARPVPVTIDLAAQSALADGAAALLVDFAGPHPFVVDGEILAQLAAGHRLLELDDGTFGWAVPQSTPEADQ